MEIIASDQIYLVEGTASGDAYSGPVGFMVLPVVYASQIGSNDLVNGPSGSDEFVLTIPGVTAQFLKALKALFNDQTYTDGTNSTTITDPKITEYAQTSADVTP